MNKKYEATINGATVKFESKSYADIFRQFWAHFKNEDLQKTIETIDLVGIRIAENEFFVAKGGQKKKNIPLTDNRWIYSHLTPKAMEKAYHKFILGWTGQYEQPQQETQSADAPVDENTTDELTSIHEELDKELEQLKQAEETVPEVENEPEEKTLTEEQEQKLEKSADSITKNDLAQEEYGVDFEDLLPTQKGKITKMFNKMNAEEQNEKQPEA